MSRVLVAYYSRTGNTASVARDVARALEADVEEIVEARPRTGAFGYWRSAFDGMFHGLGDIARVKHPVSRYDLVVVGSPVWMGSVSSPVRTFLVRHREELPMLALFCTAGGRHGERVLRDMQRVAQQIPVAVSRFRASDILQHDDQAERDRFVERIRAMLSTGPVGPRPVTPPWPDLLPFAWGE